MKETIIDVRSRAEFQGGHVVNSINIPIQEIPGRLEDIQKMKQPIILCCASGQRSAQASLFLKSHGIDCMNGGSWLDVNANY